MSGPELWAGDEKLVLPVEGSVVHLLEPAKRGIDHLDDFLWPLRHHVVSKTGHSSRGATPWFGEATNEFFV